VILGVAVAERTHSLSIAFAKYSFMRDCNYYWIISPGGYNSCIPISPGACNFATVISLGSYNFYLNILLGIALATGPFHLGPVFSAGLFH
jgi:hypothetical protein